MVSLEETYGITTTFFISGSPGRKKKLLHSVIQAKSLFCPIGSQCNAPRNGGKSDALSIGYSFRV